MGHAEGKEMRALILATLVTTFAGGAIAADANTNTSVNSTTAAPIGRLFFSPERRLTLERQRLTNIQESQTLQGATMSLDGVVQRSSGKATVWINGRAQHEGEAARTGVNAIVSPKNPGSALLAPGEESPSRLKVGEAMNRATGERDNRLGGGVVTGPRAQGSK
jgi:hypothetical protein